MTAWPPLPHAYPFRLLDRVLMVEPGRWAVALKLVSRDDRLAGPDGTYAPVLLAEMMAQAGGLAAAAAGAHVGVVAAIERFRCGRRVAVVAGERLIVTVRVVRRFGAAVKTHAAVHAGRRRCAAAEVVLSMQGSA